MREREISVDINGGAFKFLKYKQYDHNNLLKIIVKEGKDEVDLTGYTARAFFERPDGVVLEKNCTIVSNEIKLMITNDVLARKGKVSTEITLSDGNKIVTTFRMYLEVEGSIDRNSAIEEDPEWDLIKDGLGVLDTKANQSDLISLTNRVITNESDIENLENTIDVMYSSVEGSYISTDSSDGYLKDVEILGNTLQNLFDFEVLRVINNVNLYAYPQNFNLTKGKDITLVNNTDKVVIYDINNDSSWVRSCILNANTCMKATLNESEYISCCYGAGARGWNVNSESDKEKLKKTCIVLEGDHTQNPPSGYFEGIVSVGDKVEGQELYEIPVLSCGKNLNSSSIKRGNINANTGIEESGANTILCTENFIPAKPETIYIISSNISIESILLMCYNENKEYLGYCNISNGSFKTKLGTKYVKFRFWKLSSAEFTDLEVSTIKVQLEEGTIATPYEPYQEDKLTILSSVQIEKVGDVEDRLTEKDGVFGVEKNVGTVALDGSDDENWFLDSALTKENTIACWTPSVIDRCYGVVNLICDTLSVYDVYDTDTEGIRGYSGSHSILIRVKSSKLDTIDLSGFKQWLQANPTLVKYQIMTPQFIPLPHDQQVKLRTFANKTNISFLTEIEGTIKAQVPKSLGATVNIQNEQISNLNKELDRVKKLEESTVSTVETESDFTTVEATSNGYFEDVKLEGKTLVNLIDYSTMSSHGTATGDFIKNGDYVKCTLTSTGTRVANFKTFMDINNKLVTFIIYNKSSISNVRVGKKTLYESIQLLDKGLNVFTVNTSDLSEGIYVGTTANSDIDSVIEFSIMILEGDHTQNPPSYFEGLKSVGQDVDEIVVESVNENLVPSDWDYKFQCFGDIKVKQLNTRNFEIVNTNTVDGFVISKNFINKFCHNNKVIFDFYSNQIGYLYVLDYGSSGEHYKPIHRINNIKIGRNVFVVDVSKASGRIAFRFNNNTKNSTLIISDFSIKTSKNSNNVDNQSDKKRLLYYNPETQTWEKPIPREWDSIKKHSNGKYYYHQRSGEVVLNGSENWTIDNDATKETSLHFRLNGASYNLKPTDNNYSSVEVMCDKFTPRSADFVWCTNTQNPNGVYEGIATNTSCFMCVRVLKSKLSTQDLQGFKQWLQANNVTVVYQLAEEKVYECTNIDLITYANETNYIVESGAIVPKSTLKVLQNATNIIRQLQQKVSVLETDNNRIMQILSDIRNN